MKRTHVLVALAALVGSCDNGGTDPLWDGITADTEDEDITGDYLPPDVDYEAIDAWGSDLDEDGYTPAEGDCDDSLAGINPHAYDDPDNTVDDDCDTIVDNPVEGCDCDGSVNLIESMEICDGRFVMGWTDSGPAPLAGNGRGVREHYGSEGNDLDVRQGCTYAILDTGNIDPIVDICDNRQPGTDFYDTSGTGMGYCEGDEPDPDPDGGGGDAMICDTQQIYILFRAPTNAEGFSFDFLYMSTEYPEWVMAGFNDTFYAILERPATGETINISLDDFGNEIEVDNAFFESPPVTDLTGTGYSDDYYGEVCGSSTGWLRTTWPIDPGEEFALTFSIHDEGDGIYDSMVIIDNFQWSIDPVDPGTIII